MVTFQNKWSEKDKIEALKAIEDVSNALSSIVPAFSPEDAFNCAFGNITFIAGIPPGNYHGYVALGVPDEITFRPGYVTYRLVIHELGHILNDNVLQEDSPSYLLRRFGVKTALGRMVTGSGKNGYSRHMGMYAMANGYKSDVYPILQHSRWWKAGNNSLEDWADMFLSLITKNFADNPAGIALHSWVTKYLLQRLELCLNQPLALS